MRGWLPHYGCTDGGQLYGGRYLAAGSVEWQRAHRLRRRNDRLGEHPVHRCRCRGRPLVHAAWVWAPVRWRSHVGLPRPTWPGVQAGELRLHLRLGFSF